MCVPDTDGEERDPYAWLRQGWAGWPPSSRSSRATRKGDRHWPFTPQYAEVGRIDPDRVLEVLGRDVTAPLVLEVIPAFEAPDADVLADLVESVRCWREAMARSEYPVA